MKQSDRYLKIVVWSDEDQCYVGRCPGLMLGGVHGQNEAQVYQELCEVVEEWLEIHARDGMPLPAATAGRSYTGKFMLRINPDLHERLALKAVLDGDSLNNYCRKVLEKAVT